MVIVGGGRRGVGRMVAAACVGGLLLGAAGCTAAPKPAPPSPTPTITPIFASDEEALAAATEAYANYLRVYDAAWIGGPSPMDEYLALSTGEAHQDEMKSLANWKAKGWYATGTTTFDSIRLQSVELADDVQKVKTYLCLDISKGDVIDASGSSVAEPDRPMRLPLEVDFDATSPSPTDVKVSRSEVWSGKNFC